MANKKNLTDRVLLHANMMLKRDSTLTNVGKQTGYCKQTVLNDITFRLAEFDTDFYNKLQLKLKDNKYAGQLKGAEKIAERARRRKKKNG